MARRKHYTDGLTTFNGAYNVGIVLVPTETPRCCQPSTTRSGSAPCTTSTTAACTPLRCASSVIRRRPRTSSRTSSSASGAALTRSTPARPARAYLRLMARSRALDLWREGQAAGRASDRLKMVTPEDDGQSEERPDARFERDEVAARCATRCAPADGAARGARAGLLGRADRRPDRKALARPAGHREEPHQARSGAAARRVRRGAGRGLTPAQGARPIRRPRPERPAQGGGRSDQPVSGCCVCGVTVTKSAQALLST